jgi:hypothetical protein
VREPLKKTNIERVSDRERTSHIALGRTIEGTAETTDSFLTKQPSSAFTKTFQVWSEELLMYLEQSVVSARVSGFSGPTGVSASAANLLDAHTKPERSGRHTEPWCAEHRCRVGRLLIADVRVDEY